MFIWFKVYQEFTHTVSKKVDNTFCINNPFAIKVKQCLLSWGLIVRYSKKATL